MSEILQLAAENKRLAVSQKPTDFNSLPPELHIHVLQAFDSPADVLAYITASSQAARSYFESPRSILEPFVAKTLSSTAIRTGVKIHRLIASNNTLTHEELGKIGSQLSAEVCDLDLDDLTALFRLCCFHERFVQGCSEQSWLVDRVYEKAPGVADHRMASEGGRFRGLAGWEYRLRRLERPCKGGVPLHARLYSGFFSLELFIRLGGVNDEWPHYYHNPMFWRPIGPLQEAWALVYDLPTPMPYPHDDWLWCDVDLAVDLVLVSCYLGNMGYQICGEHGVNSFTAAEIAKMYRIQAFSPVVLARRAGTPVGEWFIPARDTWEDDPIWRAYLCWAVMLPTSYPTPYTWEVGHRPALPDDEIRWYLHRETSEEEMD